MRNSQVRTFIEENGGKKFLLELIVRFKYASLVSLHIEHKFNFIISCNTIRNYLREYKINYSHWGGDHKGAGYRVLRDKALAEQL